LRRFKFSLESVLIVREKTLEDERIKLASIINDYNTEKNVLNKIIEQIKEIQENSQKYLDEFGFNPQIITNYNAFLQKLAEKRIMQNKVLERIQLDIQKQQEITKQAYIQVKTLEKLKEKQKEQYDKEFLQEEFKLIDDIVNSKRTIA